MSFLGLSPGFVLLGLAALALGLFLLQRLRVRHRRVPVVTLLFWREAQEETRARVLVRRFRHLWAYLLLLLICTLLWLGFARPELSGTPSEERLLVLDGSACMLRAGRFRGAARALLARVARLPARGRTVVFAGAFPQTLLEPGEDDTLLAERLAGLKPELCPSTLAQTIWSQAQSRKPEQPLSCEIFGDGALSQKLLRLLPKKLKVRRIRLQQKRAPGPNRGLTALGASPAVSGAWNRLDVLVAVQPPAPAGSPVALSMTLGGSPLKIQAKSVRGHLLFPDVPARGEWLRLRLTGQDDWPGDDQARLFLPRRPLIRIRFPQATPLALRRALGSDPAVLSSNTRPDLLVRLDPRGEAPQEPSLDLVPMERQSAAIVIQTEERGDPQDTVRKLFSRLGLDEVDSMALAEQAGRQIRLDLRPGKVRRISLWRELLGARFDFTQSRSFPLFVARAVRYLAGQRPLVPAAAAGRPLAAQPRPWAPESGPFQDPLGSPFRPPAAGRFHDRRGRQLGVSLLDPEGTRPAPLQSSAAAPKAGSLSSRDLMTPLGLLALLLLLLEWFFLGKGRLP